MVKMAMKPMYLMIYEAFVGCGMPGGETAKGIAQDMADHMLSHGWILVPKTAAHAAGIPTALVMEKQCEPGE